MSVSINMSVREIETDNWIKLDLHIHTHDDPKDKLDYSAHEVLARARRLDFSVLAITLHDAVFDRRDAFAAAQQLGILLIPAAEMRIQGADIILLNVTAADVEHLRNFDDIRQLRARRGETLFAIAPHPFYLLGGSIGKRLIEQIDCFDAIELCHFHKGFFNPNRQAIKVAERFGKPLVATSDAHQLSAFGRHYTRIARPSPLTAEAVFAELRAGRVALHSPAATFQEIISTFYFVFIEHPLRSRFHHQQR
jgi:predicted metal-dependent phosphoesterase TrpH